MEARTEMPEEQNEHNSQIHSGLQHGRRFQKKIYLDILHVPKNPCGNSSLFEVVSDASNALSDSCEAEIYRRKSIKISQEV